MLSVKDVSYSYDNKKEIIKSISFNLNKGEFMCIVGPNGSGKTTLLKSIGKILQSKGQIKIDDIDLKNLPRKEISRKIAYFSQLTNYINDIAIFDTVMLGRYPYLKGLFSQASVEDIIKVEDALHKTGLYDVRYTSINKLSGGQLQRVFLAQIIAQDTQVILLDEPTNHLDIKYQVELLDYIKSYMETTNKIVIGVFHDLNAARKYADKILLLNDGKIELFGDKKLVLDSNEINKIYDLNIKKHMISSLEEWL